MAMQRPRGTADVSGETVRLWQRLEAVVRETGAVYHYTEVRTPVFEHTEVFERGVGDTTDIVEKEMYTFLDKGERRLTLRPEGTAGVVRAYVENKWYGQPGTMKLYYIGPMFRYEKPQSGRQRQFHQYGCEVFGSESPAVDAEVIGLHVDTLERFGIKNLKVELNSVGCPVCRPVHKEKMLAALAPYTDKLCTDCSRRLHKNPLRIFDCKNGCRDLLEEAGAPSILASLCTDCEEHFAEVKRCLTELEVPYVINESLVRGLDYYTRTAWEVTSGDSSAIGGGGRYNGLVHDLGGPETPGVGFAVGMERAILQLSSQDSSVAASESSLLAVYLVVADKSAENAALSLLANLRRADIPSDRDYQGKSVKAQFKAADREGARFVAILGESELARQVVTIKDLESGEQVEHPLSEAVTWFKGRLSE